MSNAPVHERPPAWRFGEPEHNASYVYKGGMPMRLLFVFLLVVTVTALAQQVSIAHPGPVDQYGCHYDSAGNYHCH
jgi:hypothetical protein